MRSEQHPHKRTFDSDATAVAFPLGGIGTGNISIGARGDLRDWEIFNAPNKGFRMPNTFFALWARERHKPSVCKVIEGPLPAPHTLSHGYHPSMAAGLPRFRKATFRGEYPFAFVDFEDDRMPVSVSLEAFTPLIPLDAEDSGIPCAILTYTVENTAADVVDLALAGSLINPIGGIAFDAFDNFAAGGVGQNVNEFRARDGLRGIHMRSLKYPADALQFGDLSLTTAHPHVTYKRAWLRGAWYDFLQEFWNDFGENGTLTDLNYDTPSAEGTTDTASLAIVDSLQPGDRREYRFILSWFFPKSTKGLDKKGVVDSPQPLRRTV